MDRNSQKEIGKRFIEIRDVMDFLDDGHHNEEYCSLVKVSNSLFERLTPENQEKAKAWWEKKFWEVHA